jgi:hypothetical protein
MATEDDGLIRLALVKHGADGRQHLTAKSLDAEAAYRLRRA